MAEPTTGESVKHYPCLTAWPERCPCADDLSLGEGCPWSGVVVYGCDVPGHPNHTHRHAASANGGVDD